jgi:dihydrofolate synthase/folylpolyglutamate synthase
MNYQQTIDYLYAQLPMFSKMGAAAYKEDLHNTIELCNFLDSPHKKFKSVHIAGTNGKGSTSHMLAAILQEAGYKTGLYTSPHLKDFRERIKINGTEIDENYVIDFVEKTKSISEKIQPSFFELTVAMAFDWFANEKVDIAIIETGLGGRLDSTNIISPLVSIITNIGFDHMNILGDTIELIAAEKAGIIKYQTPVIVGEYNSTTFPIFSSKATKENAPIYFAQDRFKIDKAITNIDMLDLSVNDTVKKNSFELQLDLNGMYQSKNIGAVLYAIDILEQREYSLPKNIVFEALSKVKKLTGLHGRWDIISTNPLIVLDVAHNKDGMEQVLNQLAVTGFTPNDVHFIIGMVKDKDINSVLSILPIDASYSFTNAHIPRALPANELKDKAAKYNLQGDDFDDVNEAIKNALQFFQEKKILVVCGSVFLVAEVNY